MAAAFGLATVVVVYYIGKLLYGPLVGLVAALIAAAMPYLIIVNRQILLDGPMTFFATVGLYLMARFAHTMRPVWLYAAACALGLAFLSKETSILLLGGVYAFLALTHTLAVRLRDVIVATGFYFAIVVIYPLAVALSGASSTGQLPCVAALAASNRMDVLSFGGSLRARHPGRRGRCCGLVGAAQVLIMASVPPRLVDRRTCPLLRSGP